jgi:membrane-bound serine protease (ClpP class)
MLVLLLFIIAVVFIYVELFLPGGVFGAFGLVAFIASISLAFKFYGVTGFWIAVAEIVAAVVIVMIGLKRFPQSRAGKVLILGRSLEKKLGFSGTDDFGKYIGKQGVSLTELRPAGIARIDKMRLDVVTEGTFIDKGKILQVVEVEGNRIVVREIEGAAREMEE